MKVKARAKRALKQALYAATKRPNLEKALQAAHRGAPDWPALRTLLIHLTPQPYAYRRDEVRTVRRGAEEWNFRPAHYFQWHHFFGLPDPVLDLLERLAEPGDNAIDIGANVGLYAVRLGHRVGPEGAVAAFEPNPETAHALKTHVEVNGAENVRCFEIALGDRDEASVLSDVGDGDLGKFSLRPADPIQGGLTVPVRTLDAFFAELGWDHFDLLKIDVEGFEPMTLLGARATIERYWPNLVIEVSPNWYGDRVEAYRSVFRSLARGPYTWFEIEEDGARPFDYSAWLESVSTHSRQRNLVAARSERVERLTSAQAGSTKKSALRSSNTRVACS